jgi:hypothetical protein
MLSGYMTGALEHKETQNDDWVYHSLYIDDEPNRTGIHRQIL